MITTLKTAALALALMVGTAGAAFADSAIADYDVKVKSKAGGGKTVDWLYEGEEVHVSKCTKSKPGYCWIEHKGPDGWVRLSALDFDYDEWDGDWKHADVEFCVGNWNASFCISN